MADVRDHGRIIEASPVVGDEPVKHTDIISRSHEPDASNTPDAVLTMLEKLRDFVFTPVSGPGTRSVDPLAYRDWLINVGTALGASGIALFTAKQTLLHALNAENHKIFDPMFFFERMPIANERLSTTLDTATHTELVALREAAGVRPPIPADGDKNFYGPEQRYDESPVFTLGEVADAAASKTPHPAAEPAGDGSRRVRLDSMFERTQVSLGMSTVKPDAPRGVLDARMRAAAFVGGVIPMSFKGEDDRSQVLHEQTQLPSSVVDDDEAYVPLCFTDMRPIVGPTASSGQLRTVYFRPIITSLSEGFSPDWNQGNFFGRTDPVATYQSTTRTVQLGFELHAFTAADVEVIYQKLNWLTSMVYPEYDKDMLMKAGPAVRMRVGDVISTFGPNGLSGYISSLDYDYSDSIWELRRGAKVPRSVSVSLSFTALHDGSVGRKDDGFGVMGLVFDGEKYIPYNKGSRAFRDIGTVSDVDGDTLTAATVAMSQRND